MSTRKDSRFSKRFILLARARVKISVRHAKIEAADILRQLLCLRSAELDSEPHAASPSGLVIGEDAQTIVDVVHIQDMQRATNADAPRTFDIRCAIERPPSGTSPRLAPLSYTHNTWLEDTSSPLSRVSLASHAHPKADCKPQQPGAHTLAENNATQAENILGSDPGLTTNPVPKDAGAVDTEHQDQTDNGLGHQACPSISEEANMQIFGSIVHNIGPEPEEGKILSQTPGSKHLTSGGTTDDTFGDRKGYWQTQSLIPGRELGDLGALEDPFIESPRREPGQATNNVNGSERVKQDVMPRKINADHTKVSTLSFWGRWSDEYDKFSPQPEQGVDEIAPSHELQSYQLQTPPVLLQRIPKIFRPRGPDSSEGRAAISQHASGHHTYQEHPQPQEVAPSLPLEMAISNVQQQMDELYQHVNTLFANAQTHFWNAGVYASRIASRDQELATTQQQVAQKDAELSILWSTLQERNAEIMRLQALLGEAHQSNQAHAQDEVELETSDMYGGDDNFEDTDVHRGADRRPLMSSKKI